MGAGENGVGKHRNNWGPKELLITWRLGKLYLGSGGNQLGKQAAAKGNLEQGDPSWADIGYLEGYWLLGAKI